MSIHYKFKSALNYDTVTFDGLHISVRDLKKQILQQKKIGKSTDFDLQITNAQTKDTYKNEDELIPKNTSLIVARVPLTVQQKKQWDRENAVPGMRIDDNDDGGILGKSADIASLDLPEEEKIMTMMNQSTVEYDPSKYIKVKGCNQVGTVPPTYICYKCHKTGHWIKDCPSTGSADGFGLVDPIRKSTGIPQSFMVPVDGPMVPGARMTPKGGFAVPAIDLEVYKEKKIEKPPFLAEKEKPVETTPVPDDLLCGICKDLLQDAVMAPCCGTSFCDECIRGILVESDEAECPECNEKEVSPDTLIPNRFLRNGVNNFKNKTGYTKKAQPARGQSPPRPTLPDFVPPGQEKESSKVMEEVKEKEDSNAAPNKAEDTSMLYDFQEENEELKRANEKKDRHSYENNRDRFQSDADKENIDFRRDGKGRRDSDDSKDSADRQVYSIASISDVRPQTNIGLDPSSQTYFPSKTVPLYLQGEERSATPTVDERYDPYGRPPGQTFQAPAYDPRYPPPGPQQFNVGYARDHQPTNTFRGRYRQNQNLITPHASHGPHGPHGPPHQPEGLYREDKYAAWMAWMKEKEERGKRKHLVRSRVSGSRSRSPSPDHRRSYTPKRSRSRSRSSRRSVSRRRTPSRSRTPVRSRSRSRSFVMSPRSRSRSYSKSPMKLSPKKYISPARSPYRSDRYVEQAPPPVHYAGDRGFGWDRRGGFRSRGRGRPYISPQRGYPPYHRYREEFGTSPPPRNFSPGHRFRDRSPRWDEYRRRSRSGSNARVHYDEDRVRRSGSIDSRSLSRGRRERERTPPIREERHRSRERWSRERNGTQRIVREKSREYDREKRHREPSVETGRGRDGRERMQNDRDRSRSRSKRRSSPVKENRRKSGSPGKKYRRSSEERSVSRNRKRDGSGPRQKVPEREEEKTRIAKSEPAPALEKKSIAVDTAEVSSPSVSDNAKLSKRDKKKDKEKKKRKKEKETDEEREARKKRKREKKEEKKRKLEMQKTSEVKEEIKQDHPVDEAIYQIKVVPELAEEALPESPSIAIIKSAANASPPNIPESTESSAVARTPPPSNEEVLKITNSSLPAEVEGMLNVLASPEMLARIPELSKWELDDIGLNVPMKPSSSSPETPRVTTEVLKRAENAIFKKAISAIKEPSSKKASSEKPEPEKKVRKQEPQEPAKRTTDSPIKEKPKDRRSDREKEKSFRSTVEIPKKNENRKPGNSLQITIPVSNAKEEREVGYGPASKSSRSPPSRVSIKDRLGSKVEAPSRISPAVVLRLEERSRPTLPSTVETSDSKRVHLEESTFIPNYESSGEDVRPSKSKRSIEIRKRSPEHKKRQRTSSDSSGESVRKSKKKKAKNKKDKKAKKKKKEASESSDSSESETERKKHKKSKKKRKTRH